MEDLILLIKEKENEIKEELIQFTKFYMGRYFSDGFGVYIRAICNSI
jgi:hypothetical protein